MTDKKTLEDALAEMEASNLKHAPELAAQIAKRDELDARLEALPEKQRRQVLGAAGLIHVSRAPPPIEPLSGHGLSATLPQKPTAIVEVPKPQAAPDAPVVKAPASETAEQRRTRWLDWYGKGERGAVQRVYERELLLNPKADRGFIGKQIRKAKIEQADKKRGGAWASQLVRDGKR